MLETFFELATTWAYGGFAPKPIALPSSSETDRRRSAL
jgi:hypothetical protein